MIVNDVPTGDDVSELGGTAETTFILHAFGSLLEATDVDDSVRVVLRRVVARVITFFGALLKTTIRSAYLYNINKARLIVVTFHINTD